VDEDGRVLDGVHRVRIARELAIDLPVQRHEGLDDDRKLHLAVGLNMRRRHLDADRRRELVRKLHQDEGLSVRKIAAVAGWSKSTIDRDLKASPFEERLATIAEWRDEIESIPDEQLREGLASFPNAFGALYGQVDGDWKARRRRSDVELTEMTLFLYDMDRLVRNTIARLGGDEPRRLVIRGEPWDGTTLEWWETLDIEDQERMVRSAREMGVLDRWEPPVPSGTR
jgi:hypothetical protein